MDISSRLKQIAVNYHVETKTAVKAGIVLVIALMWRDLFQSMAEGLRQSIKSKTQNPIISGLISAAAVTLIGVIAIYVISEYAT